MTLVFLGAFVVCLWAFSAEWNVAFKSVPSDELPGGRRYPGIGPSKEENRRELLTAGRRFLSGCVWAWVWGCGAYQAVRLCFPGWYEAGVHGGAAIGVVAACLFGVGMTRMFREINQLGVERADFLQHWRTELACGEAMLKARNDPAVAVAYLQAKIDERRAACDNPITFVRDRTETRRFVRAWELAKSTLEVQVRGMKDR